MSEAGRQDITIKRAKMDTLKHQDHFVWLRRDKTADGSLVTVMEFREAGDDAAINPPAPVFTVTLTLDESAAMGAFLGFEPEDLGMPVKRPTIGVIMYDNANA
jgi:hypothetical protein